MRSHFIAKSQRRNLKLGKRLGGDIRKEWPKGYCMLWDTVLGIESSGKGEEGLLGVTIFVIFVSPSKYYHSEALLPGGSWTSACRWEAGNSSFLLCSCMPSLLLLNCCCLPLGSSCLSSVFLPIPWVKGARGRLCCWLGPAHHRAAHAE